MKRPAEDDIPMQDPPAHLTNGHKADMMEKRMEEEVEEDMVAILDCGAQYGKVIDRRVREMAVHSHILPLNTPAKELRNKYKAIIISGGPNSVYAEDAPDYDSNIFSCGLPVLGICYGFQMINHQFGGHVESKRAREDGTYETQMETQSPIFSGLGKQETVMLTHGDTVTKVADGFTVIAKSGDIIAGIANESKKIYGLQFHPEVDLTINGKKMFENFLFKVAGCRGGFTMKGREAACIEEIRQFVGEKKVLVMVSGGVDSTVCAALLHSALGKSQVIALHIDNGFMRKDETIKVKHALRKLELKTLKKEAHSPNGIADPEENGLHLKVHNAHYQFLYGTTTLKSKEGDSSESDLLCRIEEPEIKRRIIGDTFMKVKDEQLEKLKLDPKEVILAQGTLRPDLIESASSLASSHADAIKTHHNDTEFVRVLRREGKVIEPLKDFHKDEVRQLGRDLGLPEEIVSRHPFPGPGLAIRILCALQPFVSNDFANTAWKLRLIAQYSHHLKKDDEGLDELREGMSGSEAERLKRITEETPLHSTLLPVKSVGVQGDRRSYSYVVALSTDTHPPPWTSLFYVARLIPRFLRNVNRVVFVFGKGVCDPVLDVTPTLLNDHTVSLTQEVDAAATDVLNKSSERVRIAQMPVVLVPVHFDRSQEQSLPSVKWSVCLRPFITNDFMTGRAAVPGPDISEKVVNEMVDAVSKVRFVSRVMYDMTPKPPGTTEWE